MTPLTKILRTFLHVTFNLTREARVESGADLDHAALEQMDELIFQQRLADITSQIADEHRQPAAGSRSVRADLRKQVTK